MVEWDDRSCVGQVREDLNDGSLFRLIEKPGLEEVGDTLGEV